MPNSLRSRLFALWLPGIVIAIVLIAGYGTYTAYKRDTASAHVRLQSMANSYATDANTELERALDVARTLAHTFCALKVHHQPISREQVNAMMEGVLRRNPSFIAVYTAWEPNAFDGRDATVTGVPRPDGKDGHDSTRRFSSYWSRSSGRVQREVYLGTDTRGIGTYYLLSKETQRECLLEPYFYPVQGKRVMMTSLIVPIFVNKQFCGVCAVDIALDYLQSEVNKADIFDHAGTVSVLSSKGTVVSMTQRPDVAGKPAASVFGAFSSASSTNAESHLARRGVTAHNDTLYAVSPMKVGMTEAQWSAVVSVPEHVVITPLTTVTLTQLYVAGAVIATLALIVWLFAARMLRAIAALQTATETFAAGNLEALVAIHTNDELSDVGHSFNQMANRIRAMMDELRSTQARTEQTQHELYTSEQRLRAVLETTPFVAIQFYDKEGRVLYWNNASERIFGWTADDAMGKTLDALIHTPAEAATFVTMLEGIHATGQKVGPAVYPFRHKNGGTGVCMSTTFAIPTPDSTEPTFVCMDVDVTEQKLAEEALQQSKRDLDTILRNMLIGVAVNIHHRYVFTNAALSEILGYSDEEFRAIPDIHALVHDADRDVIVRRYQERIAGINAHHDTVEIRCRHKRGHDVWVEVSGLLITYQGEQAMLTTFVDISERKCAEEALQTSQQSLHTIMETMQIGISVTQDGRYVFANSALSRILGFTKEELVALPDPWQLIHPEDVPRVRQRYAERLAGIRSHSALEDVRYRRKAGDYVWVAAAGVRMDYEGRTATLVTFVDASERRRAEEALRQSEQNVRTILETMVVGIIVTKGDTFLFINNAFCRMMGYELDELFALKDVWSLVHTDDREALRARYKARMNGEALPSPTFEVRYRHKQGHDVWTEIAGGRILYEGELVGIATVSNITERKQAEEQVRRTQENQRKILETMGVAVTVTRGDGVLFINQEWQRMVGYTVEEAMTMDDIYNIMHPESRAKVKERTRARLRGEHVPDRYEERLIHKNGSTIWIELAAFVMEYEGAPAVLASFVDITERKRAMQELEEALREKERLLFALDQQTAAAMRSFIQGQEDERHRIAQDLHDGVGHLLSLVKIGLSSFQEHVQAFVPARQAEFEQFLSLYDRAVQEVRAVSHQLMPATLRKMGLKAALADLITMVSLSAPMRVDASLDALDEVVGYLSNDVETSIFRIVQELVNNTIKYAQASTISIQIIHNAGRLLCIYEDDGVGFDTQHTSDGIGLRNVHNRALLLGGSVELDSAPGNGMAATLDIPLNIPLHSILLENIS